MPWRKHCRVWKEATSATRQTMLGTGGQAGVWPRRLAAVSLSSGEPDFVCFLRFVRLAL